LGRVRRPRLLAQRDRSRPASGRRGLSHQTSRVPDDAQGSSREPRAPLFTTTIALTEDVRRGLAPAGRCFLGALTGRPGGFASRMVYVANIGASRRVFELDSDGFDLHAPALPTPRRLSPVLRFPGDVLFYALSRKLSPFRLATRRGGCPRLSRCPVRSWGWRFPPIASRWL